MDIKAYNEQIITEFRANGGKVGGPFAGAPLLLLGTIGAKSGAERINPLAYFDDGGRLLIIASYAGADTNPPWFHNLVANPAVTVEVGAEKFAASATVLPEPERTTVFERLAAQASTFADYQRKTSRVIPVVALERT